MLGLTKKDIVNGLKIMCISFFLVFLLRWFLFVPTTVQGKSMEPTLHDGDIMMINRMNILNKSLERFDIIVFEKNEEHNYVKRIIGLEGDKIEYIEDELFINGKKFYEPYLNEEKNKLTGSERLTGNFTLQEYLGEEEVPEGHVFVLGDNRWSSDDSRNPEVGFVPIDKIIGKCSSSNEPMSENIKFKD